MAKVKTKAKKSDLLLSVEQVAADCVVNAYTDPEMDDPTMTSEEKRQFLKDYISDVLVEQPWWWLVKKFDAPRAISRAVADGIKRGLAEAVRLYGRKI